MVTKFLSFSKPLIQFVKDVKLLKWPWKPPDANVKGGFPVSENTNLRRSVTLSTVIDEISTVTKAIGVRSFRVFISSVNVTEGT